jgi:hypothetical protein
MVFAAGYISCIYAGCRREEFGPAEYAGRFKSERAASGVAPLTALFVALYPV